MLRVDLPLEQWRLVASALAELPAKTSMGLILDIDRQVQAQLTETTVPEPDIEAVEVPAPPAETFGRRKP